MSRKDTTKYIFIKDYEDFTGSEYKVGDIIERYGFFHCGIYHWTDTKRGYIRTIFSENSLHQFRLLQENYIVPYTETLGLLYAT